MLAREKREWMSVRRTVRRLVAGALIGATVAGYAGWADAQTYNVVVDAGSSGSRVYVYETAEGRTRSIFDKKESKPLADGAVGVLAVQNLFVDARDWLKKHREEVAPGTVRADVLGTAGMRLLAKRDEEQETKIYGEAKKAAEAAKFEPGEFRTISGAEEGLFAWSAVKHLEPATERDKPEGIVEVGGASAQVAFAADDLGEANTFDIALDGKSWRVFSVTFLGLGQDQAAKQLAEEALSARCKPISDDGYNVKDCKAAFENAYRQPGVPEALEVATSALDTHRAISFAGLSGVNFALLFANSLGAPETASFDDKIEHNCKKENYVRWDAKVREEEKARLKCERGAYISTFVYDKLGIPANKLKAVSKIDGQDASWTLGYLVTQVRRAPAP